MREGSRLDKGTLLRIMMIFIIVVVIRIVKRQEIDSIHV